MKKAILPFLLTTGACATTAPEPLVEVREVAVPTPVACVDPARIPAEPPTVGQRFNGDAKHDLQILAPNAQALRQWGQEMKAMLDACVAAAGPAAAAPTSAPAG